MNDTPRVNALMLELAGSDQDDLERFVDLATELESELIDCRRTLKNSRSTRLHLKLDLVIRKAEKLSVHCTDANTVLEWQNLKENLKL